MPLRIMPSMTLALLAALAATPVGRTLPAQASAVRALDGEWI